LSLISGNFGHLMTRAWYRELTSCQSCVQEFKAGVQDFKAGVQEVKPGVQEVKPGVQEVKAGVQVRQKPHPLLPARRSSCILGWTVGVTGSCCPRASMPAGRVPSKRSLTRYLLSYCMLPPACLLILSKIAICLPVQPRQANSYNQIQCEPAQP